MHYLIRLTIAHEYDQPAALGRQLIRVVPKPIEGRQRVIAHSLDIAPAPFERIEGTDFFGNAVVTSTHADPHSTLEVVLTSEVSLTPVLPPSDLSPPLASLKADWQRERDLGPASPLHFLGPTARLTPDPDIAAFARAATLPNGSVTENVIRLGEALHEAMTFDSRATTVDTDASEAFRLRRGVCQDFAHIMILGLQSLGIPAGYVSGYLRTLPPEGGEKLEGVDAMHAWVKAWCGVAQGWMEYDPTNRTLIGGDHIVVGYGREYNDIAPTRGRLRSSGRQKSSQVVDVSVVDAVGGR